MREHMTVHKALSELKILNNRIESAIENLDLVSASKHSNAKIQGLSISDWCDEAKKAYQSVTTLINRRNAIKRAVTRSNASTMVTIGDKEYTVAEAIDMKSVGIDQLRALTSKLSSEYAHAKRNADNENARLEMRADEYVKSLYSGSELKNMSDEIVKVRDTFITAQTWEIVDPIKAGAEAERLQAEIDAFMSDVDAALSVSNALTTVDVVYETK